ncbi:HAD hydrolase-like protein [Nostoc sp.]|uniref:HAD hydrolase-like protein n=1 Tax=Nostoc sp. TaxID=1180 RepID=UPI002FF86AD0
MNFELLTLLFDGVYGSELDGTRSIKGDLIHHILLTEKLLPSTVVMVGDRSHDIIGAKRHHIASIGVTYGYGTEEELKAHGADLIAHSPSDILRLIILNDARSSLRDAARSLLPRSGTLPLH